MSEPAIEVRDVGKRFRVVHQASTLKREALERLFRPRRRVDQFEALHGIEFTVAAGETVGLIGHNGSGKSTMLTLLAGIYRPTSGTITVRGRIGTLLDLGAGFHPELTAEDNAVMSAIIHGLNRREACRKMDDIVRFAGLEAFADTKVKHFSSGMILRLGFSVVVHTEPDVLLVDEVLLVGDEAFQHRCRETIAQLQRDGRTIVFVSHDLETMAAVAPRVIWLDGGRIRGDGAAAAVIAAYEQAVADGQAGRLPTG